ncbi:unnamed protein product [Staurois parvus]|uniref:Uncharacterized protein n=1 Tax=Staurois parvus TaxID=386267 RepID=A0ABN9ARH1_9NEOB|nr:unnamed protein product [Staurois parvus]
MFFMEVQSLQTSENLTQGRNHIPVLSVEMFFTEVPSFQTSELSHGRNQFCPVLK